MRTYGYRCDRCGDEFGSEPSCEIVIRYPSLADPPTMDLCGGCTRDLRAWLKSGPQAEPQTDPRVDGCLGVLNEVAELMETNVDCIKGMCDFMTRCRDTSLADGNREAAEEWERKRSYEEVRLALATELRNAVKMRMEGNIPPWEKEAEE